ncbi:uncharacterized protein [Engystomops pustulosus]|uniref:uncharacterized protein n=1 Tax=Engystomops pustulosus TaxID=76066 RepID=UPI003AFB37DE
MRRRRRRGGAHCARVLNTNKALKTESTSLVEVTFDSVAQFHLQEEKKEDNCMRWHLRRRQDHGEVKGLRRRRRTWNTRHSIKSDDNPPLHFLPIKEKGRPRNTRFSNIENITLISRLLPVYEQLLGKGKSITTFHKRNQMWQEICDAVNAVGNKQRLIPHCKKRFHDIKRLLRNKLNREKGLLSGRAGPAAFQVYYTPYEEELKKVLPAEIIDGIEFYDSDLPQEHLQVEAGPSWYTPQNNQKMLREKSSKKFSEALQGPLCIGLLDDQWSMLSELSVTVPMDLSTVQSVNFSTDLLDRRHGQPTDPRKRKLYHAGYSAKQNQSCSMPNPTPNPGEPLLQVLNATQRSFRKGMRHSLNVLQSDVGHLNKCINESNSIANDLLKVAGERNRTLHQMNIQLGKLAEGVEQLVNQQQAEQILLHDLSRRQNLKGQSLIPSRRRGKRIGGGHVGSSFRVTSTSMTCLSQPGFMLDAHGNNMF